LASFLTEADNSTPHPATIGRSINDQPLDSESIRGLVETHAPRLLETFDAAQDNATRAAVLLDAARQVEFTSRRSAVRFAESSVSLALSVDDPELVVTAQLLLAFQLNESNRSLEAFQHTLEAIAVARSLSDSNISPYLRALSTRAVIRAVVGDLAGARRDYKAILDVPLGQTDIVTLVVARLNLSSMYIESDRPSRALHHLSIVEEQLSTSHGVVPDQPGYLSADRSSYFQVALEQNRADASLQLADALQQKGRHEQIPRLIAAVRSSCVRIERAIEPNDRFNQMLVHTLRSGADRIDGDIASAILEGDAAVALARQLGQSVYPQPHIAQARAFDATQRWDDSIVAWTAAGAIARRAGHSTLIGRILDDLSRSYEQLGDTGTALRLTRESLQHARDVMDRVDQLAELEHDTTALDNSLADDETSWRERLWIAERQASLDPLTGLLNRRGLALRLTEAPKDPDSNRSRLVALLDIDHFKRVNDIHSHHAGDRVLQTVAHILADSVPAQALVARYGGEEFAIVMDSSDLQIGRTMLDTVRRAVEMYDWSDIEVAVTVSIGFALQRNSEFADALADADAALYEAKRAGRNVVYPVVGGSVEASPVEASPVEASPA